MRDRATANHLLPAQLDPSDPRLHITVVLAPRHLVESLNNRRHLRVLEIDMLDQVLQHRPIARLFHPDLYHITMHPKQKDQGLNLLTYVPSGAEMITRRKATDMPTLLHTRDKIHSEAREMRTRLVELVGRKPGV